VLESLGNEDLVTLLEHYIPQRIYAMIIPQPSLAD